MHTYQQLYDYVNNHLLDYLPKTEESAQLIYESEKYSLTCGGKRVRPILLLASCEACGGNIEDALPYAIAMEYIHTYSLIHDDLPAMDNDDFRRGKPTNHKVYGDAIATLAGDGLLTAAFQVMAKAALVKCDPSRISAMHIIAKNAGNQGMVGGQVADITDKDEDEKLLEFIHRNKTGALFNAACMAGGYLANADGNSMISLNTYSRNIGYAFQIADDILDREENETVNYVKFYGLNKAYEDLDYRIDEAISAIDELVYNNVLMKIALNIKESV